jgi:hypothetical protein
MPPSTVREAALSRRFCTILSLTAAAGVLTACGVKDANLDTGEEIPVTYSDEDGDTIIDHMEGLDVDDADGDGVPNYLDLDSDGDTIDDQIEAGDEDPLSLPVDSDGDGTYDFLDLDSDDNCIEDREEKGGPNPKDSDGDGRQDFNDPDNDGDGINDVYELGAACDIPDSDGDGTPDYLDTDSDGDGIDDYYEAGTSAWSEEPVDTDGDGTPDYLDLDSDDDGFSDSEEAGSGDTPADTDGDGTYDFADTDSDGDGLSDWEEANVYGTDPYNEDSDGDDFSDGAEVEFGSDPGDDSSGIEGVYVEVPERDTTEQFFPFELNIQMGDIAFVLDTTGSMGTTATAMANEFSAIVSQLSTAIPDAHYGVAQYDDYYFSNYGSRGDKPFELLTPVTGDISMVQTVLSNIDLHSGNDAPESGMEALYQAATGAGYDQNCNGIYDADTDVKPFQASASDPFGGAGGQFDSDPSSGGDIGGFGFRAGALPVIVIATDNILRDPEAGYGTPHGCPGDAGYTDVTSSINDIGAKLIGISVNGNTPYTQMFNLALATNSFADTNGDGYADDELVFQWSSGSSNFRNTVAGAIEDLVGSIQFDEISLEIEGDEWGFVTDIEPDTISVDGFVNGQTITFTLTFLGTVASGDRDQYYNLTLNVYGDGTTLLDSQDIVVVVPGTSY